MKDNNSKLVDFITAAALTTVEKSNAMKNRLESLQDHMALCQREISSLNRLNKMTSTNSAVATIRNKTKNFIHFEEEGEGIGKDIEKKV